MLMSPVYDGWGLESSTTFGVAIGAIGAIMAPLTVIACIVAVDAIKKQRDGSSGELGLCETCRFLLGMRTSLDRANRLGAHLWAVTDKNYYGPPFVHTEDGPRLTKDVEEGDTGKKVIVEKNPVLSSSERASSGSTGNCTPCDTKLSVSVA